MEVKINSDYGIKTDKLNFSLCRLEQKVNDEGEKVTKFVNLGKHRSTLDGILEVYKNHRIRTEMGIKSIEELRELLKVIKQDIKEIREKLEV